MKIQTLFAISFAAFVLLQLWVVPAAEAAWATNRSFAKIAKAAFLAALKTARTMSQIAALVYGALLLTLMLTLTLEGPLSAAAYLRAIEMLEQIRSLVSSISKSILGNISFGIAVLGLGYFTYRRHRADLIEEVQQTAERESARLRAALEAGSWEEIPPDAEMTQIALQLKVLRSAAAEEKDSLRKDWIINIATQLEDQLVTADFMRRIDFGSPPVKRVSFVRRLWPRVFLPLISTRFVKDTSMASRWCSQIACGVLMLSLVGIGATSVDTILGLRITSLWDLEVKASRDEAKESWARANAKRPDISDIAPEDVRQTQAISRAFIQAYLNSDAWVVSGTTAQEAKEPHLRGAIARKAIIENHIDRQRPSGLERPLPPTTAPPQDIALNELRRITLNPESTSSIEVRLAEKLQREALGPEAGLWSRFKGKLASHIAEYGEAAKPNDFAKAILGEILDPALEALQVDLAAEHAKHAQKIVRGAVKAAIERSIEIRFDRFLADLAGDASLRDALSTVEKTPVRLSGLTPTEISLMRSAVSASRQRLLAANFERSTLNRQPAIRSHAERISELALQLVRDPPPRSVGADHLDFLAEYDDYFGGERRSVEKTLRNQLLMKAGFTPKEEELSKIVERARDFKLLDGFRRVGGVVIGRYPNQGSGSEFDIRAVEWRLGDGRISLLLRDADGKEITLGPYLPDIVYRALLFAADGRPMVVTILNTELEFQKVTLHPAIEGTRIGCEMIELDSFVFHYLKADILQHHSVALEKVRDYDAVYRIGIRSALKDIVVPDSQPTLERGIANILSQRPNAALTLTDPALFGDPRRSPLAAGYAIYYAPALAAMKACTGGGGVSMVEFRTCMANAGSRHITGSKKEFLRWKADPKEFEFVSGVRDEPFSVDKDMQFLRPPRGTGKNATWPLYFLIQDTNDAVDADARWSFPALSESISKGIADLVDRNKVARDIVSHARDFAVLQRLFRVAFDGLLGQNLPIHRLVMLAEVTQALARDEHPNVQWIVSETAAENSLRQLQSLATGIKDRAAAPVGSDLADGLASITTCQRALSSASKSRRIDTAMWNASCVIGAWASSASSTCASIADDERPSHPACRLGDYSRYVKAASARLEMADLIGVPKEIPPKERRQTPRGCR